MAEADVRFTLPSDRGLREAIAPHLSMSNGADSICGIVVIALDVTGGLELRTTLDGDNLRTVLMHVMPPAAPAETDVPAHVTDESRADIDEWAAESRAQLALHESTRFAAGQIADVIAALGHPGAGRALADAGYVASNFADSLARVAGQQLDASDALALLGMAGLVLADREQEAAR